MTRSPRLAGVLFTATVATLGAAEPAAAKITFSGIGGIRLGTSESEVRAEVGEPSSERRWKDRRTVVLIYLRRRVEVLVDRQADTVVGVKTTSRAQRTAAGLGVGSSLASVRATLRGEKCGSAAGTLVCSVARAERVMDFDLRRGRVVRVSVTRAG